MTVLVWWNAGVGKGKDQDEPANDFSDTPCWVAKERNLCPLLFVWSDILGSAAFPRCKGAVFLKKIGQRLYAKTMASYPRFENFEALIRYEVETGSTKGFYLLDNFTLQMLHSELTDSIAA